MTQQEQNKALANDILERNWYPYFKDGSKVIELVVGRGKYHIACSHSYDLLFKEEEKQYNCIEQFKKFVEWYDKNNFSCDIILDGISSITELEKYLECAQSKFLLHVPLDVDLYLQNKGHFIWSSNKVAYHFSGWANKLDLRQIDVPCTIYWSDNSPDKWLFNSTLDLSTITWKFIIPQIFDEMNRDNIYNTIIHYYTQKLSELGTTNFIKLLSSDKCFFPLKYNYTFHNLDKIPCGMTDRLTLDLNTMGVYPCPVLDNIEFNMGRFDFDNNRNFEPNIVELMIMKDHIRQGICIGCDACYAKGFCDKPCLAQGYYESMVFGSVGKDYDTHDMLHILYIKLIGWLDKNNLLNDFIKQNNLESVSTYIKFLVSQGEEYGY